MKAELVGRPGQDLAGLLVDPDRVLGAADAEPERARVEELADQGMAGAALIPVVPVCSGQLVTHGLRLGLLLPPE